ncbi:hypothetical protein [Chitinophaga vietnamensis]|uniref:hypothetical protein n=1 Tax=Chitinophaga vietnamensis TaxID=2593957 RepID=UPI001177DCE5|nr:hypothetical protein [Chitinophaga vietnamensis]
MQTFYAFRYCLMLAGFGVLAACGTTQRLTPAEVRRNVRYEEEARKIDAYRSTHPLMQTTDAPLHVAAN